MEAHKNLRIRQFDSGSVAETWEDAVRLRDRVVAIISMAYRKDGN